MVSYEIELHALIAILLENKTYNEAMFKITQEEKLSSLKKKTVSEIVLGVLRHYFCLSFEGLSILQYKRDCYEHILTIISLYELRYKKKNVDEVKEAYKRTFLSEKLDGEYTNNINKIIESSKEAFNIPEIVKNSPYLFNSLLLEMPEFLLKILSKETSNREAMSISTALHRRSKNSFSPLDENLTIDSFSDLEYKKVIFLDSSFICYRRKNISLKEMRQNHYYPLGYLDGLAYSHLNINGVMPKILMSDVSDGLKILPLYMKTKSLYKVKIVCSFDDEIKYRRGIDVAENFKLKNVELIQSDISLLKTHILENDYDNVICYGDDCNIGLSRRMPSILPTLTESKISTSCKRQMVQLKENSRFVKKGGSLLFINHSLINEESKDVIHQFLNDNHSFNLVHEEIVYPNKVDDDGGYFAIINRRGDDND